MGDTTTDILALEPQPAKGARYWARRIGIGVGGIFATLIIVFGNVHGESGSPIAVAIVLTALSLVGTHELFRAIRTAERAEPTSWLAYVACVVFQIFALANSSRLEAYREAVIALLIVSSLLAELVKPRRTPIENIGATLIGALYVGWLMSFLTLIRVGNYPFIHPPVSFMALIHIGHYPIIHPPIPDNANGAWVLMYVLLIAMAGDTGALCAGYLLGRHKLAPAISPSKTLEGAAGGIICAIAAAVLFGRWIAFPAEDAPLLGVLIGGIGLLGDLCESAMKRELGIKDFGKFFGNHGGVLDRCDSLLFTGPAAYYYMLFLLHR